MNLILGHLYPTIRLPRLRRARQLLETYRTKERLRGHGPLSPALVDEWISDNLTRVEGTEARKIRQHAVSEDSIADAANRGMVQKGAALLCRVVSANENGIGSIASVGARIDPTMSFMAGRFPRMTVTSIDMQSDLAEINSGLPQHDNWHFLPGYAYDVFHNTDFAADVVYMTSTASKINTEELEAYLGEFRKKVRFLVINEPWWAFPLGLHSLRLLRPEDIDPEASRIGGFVGDYQHNYVSILPRHKFEILRLELLPGNLSSGGWHNILQMVAVNRDLLEGEVGIADAGAPPA